MKNEFLKTHVGLDVAGLPATLKKLPRWVCWKLTPAEPKPAKIPVAPTDAGKLVNASVTNPANWMEFDVALGFYNAGACSGIGFCLDSQDGVCCVDVDHCIDQDGNLTELAREIITLCGCSFVEVSQSGTGIHIWFVDKKFSTSARKGDVEVYGAARFIAVTGCGIDFYNDDLVQVDGACNSVIEKYCGGFSAKPTTLSVLVGARLEDSQLQAAVDAMRNDEKFQRLMAGDTTGYSSASEADAALVSKLIWLTNGNVAQIKSVFMKSKLADREKVRTRADYLDRTIDSLLKKWTGEHYTPAGDSADVPPEWVKANGTIEPAVMKQLATDAEYLSGLKVADITSTVATGSKTLWAVARLRFYDFYREVADKFMARVKVAIAEAKILETTDEAVIALASVVPSKLEETIATYMTETKKNHGRYQKKLRGEKAQVECERRQAAAKVQQEKSLERLKELKAMPETEARNAEMRALIKELCTWKENRRGQKVSIKSTAANYALIFENDPLLEGLVGYDEFKQADVFLKPAHWKKEFKLYEEWSDSDDSALRVFLRLTYAEIANTELYTDFLSVHSRRKSFHVVKDFFKELPAWDGEPRAEKLFVDYLQVEDSAFTREVTLNWLLGAVARIFEPGCEYQTCLVLNGEQGIGKTGILKKLAGDWYVSLKDNVEDTHAVDAIQTGWIVEMEEFKAGRKAEVNTLKAFVSSSADDRRAPYARRATKSKRHCVFSVTCNDKQFLKDATGNRRFMILQSKAARNDNSAIKRLNQETVAQLWAEVLHKYTELFKDGFSAGKLELSDEAKRTVEEVAEAHMLEDGLKGEIEAFLEMRILPTPVWKLLTKEQRRQFKIDSYIELADEDWEMRASKLNGDEREEYEAFMKDKRYIRAGTIRSRVGVEFLSTLAYGSVRRNETCAAEIFNECFGNDRRKSMSRISEVLSLLDGWELVKPQCKNFAGCYGNQKRRYKRVEAISPVDLEARISAADDQYRYVDEDIDVILR